MREAARRMLKVVDRLAVHAALPATKAVALVGLARKARL
jgi:hypothetical protein